MPEATVDKNNRMIFWKYQIGLAWQPSVMDTITKANPVKHFTQNQFRTCIFALYSSHHFASCILRNNISHYSLHLFL